MLCLAHASCPEAASFSLEIAFRRQKATAKLLTDALCYLLLSNQEDALVRPGKMDQQLGANSTVQVRRSRHSGFIRNRQSVA